MRDTHDYLVDPLNIEQLESRAKFYRQKWNVSDARLSVIGLLFENVPEHLRNLGLKMIAQTNSQMGDKQAFARSKPKRIFFRAKLLAHLRFGDPEAAKIFVHELGHVILHPQAPMAWMVGGNNKEIYIPQESSAEWQATMFALCLLAPAHLAKDCATAEMLAAKFGLGRSDAEERFEILRKQRPRKIPTGADPLHSSSLSQNMAMERCPDCGSYMPAQSPNRAALRATDMEINFRMAIKSVGRSKS